MITLVMVIRQGLSESNWKKIRAFVDSGWKLVDIERRFNGLVTAKQISAKKQIWKKEEFNKDPRYARFHTPQYRSWRLKALIRDKFKCIICKRGRPQVLQIDHILPWSVSVETRFDINNAQTLCLYHHKRTPTYGKKAITYVATKEKNLEWVRKERDLWQQNLIKKRLKKKFK